MRTPAHAHCMVTARRFDAGRARDGAVYGQGAATARHRSCLFCYTCALATAHGDGSLAQRRRRTKVALRVAESATGQPRPQRHRPAVQCAIDASAHADEHRCRHAKVPSPLKAAPMLHHVSLGVRTIEISAAFYDATLGALGYVRVWSDLEPCTHDQAVGYGRPGGEDCLALKQRHAMQCAPGPTSILRLPPPVRRPWTASIAPRYSTAATAMAHPACDRTMAMTITPRSSSTRTGTPSKRWSTVRQRGNRHRRYATLACRCSKPQQRQAHRTH
ncbi:hypothetical protein C8F00_3210 [Xanthomonas vasicola]